MGGGGGGGVGTALLEVGVGQKVSCSLDSHMAAYRDKTNAFLEGCF